MNDAFQVQRSVESMPEELRETELSCNPELRNAYAALLYPHEMAAEKKNAVTAYVLARIAELDATYGAVAEAYQAKLRAERRKQAQPAPAPPVAPRRRAVG